MTRVVESVIPDFGSELQVKKIVTKEMAGALRYGELSKRLGRPAPVPSIFIDEKLIFEITPGREELIECLNRCLGKGRG